MNLLIILLVMEQNGMYIPAWAMGLAWVMLVFSGLAVIVKALLNEYLYNSLSKEDKDHAD